MTDINDCFTDYFFKCMRNPETTREEMVSALEAKGIKYCLWLNSPTGYEMIDDLQFKYQNTEWKLYFKLPEGKLFRVKCVMLHNKDVEEGK